ncbi:hypothetical protein [uncultured Thiodictyon sp.]|uniref:hypothetical protein n=1 Tax=uncultured Thiodictyon sp. TaxID=1846217 RepID=UPI0025E52E5D|nr:hypothetical protein [uncultured Thiodictyon sp.]
MKIQSKTGLAIAALMLSTSAFAYNTGYYVQRPIQVTIPGGPTTNFGPVVPVLTTTVEPGSYLITARIDGQSTAPKSGAQCYFTYDYDGHQYQVGTQYYAVNTSSDWTRQVNVSAVALNRFTAPSTAQVSLMCTHGYLFSNASIFGGEMTLTPVDAIGP